MSNKIFLEAIVPEAAQRSFLEICKAQSIEPYLVWEKKQEQNLYELAATRPTAFEIIRQAAIKELHIIFR